jgi:hypothetical protein
VLALIFGDVEKLLSYHDLSVLVVGFIALPTPLVTIALSLAKTRTPLISI